MHGVSGSAAADAHGVARHGAQGGEFGVGVGMHSFDVPADPLGLKSVADVAADEDELLVGAARLFVHPEHVRLPVFGVAAVQG